MGCTWETRSGDRFSYAEQINDGSCERYSTRTSIDIVWSKDVCEIHEGCISVASKSHSAVTEFFCDFVVPLLWVAYFHVLDSIRSLHWAWWKVNHVKLIKCHAISVEAKHAIHAVLIRLSLISMIHWIRWFQLVQHVQSLTDPLHLRFIDDTNGQMVVYRQLIQSFMNNSMKVKVRLRSWRGFHTFMNSRFHS